MKLLRRKFVDMVVKVNHCQDGFPGVLNFFMPDYIRKAILPIMTYVYIYAKQKHLGCKKGEANQKQQLSDYKSIHSYTCD